MESKKVRGKSYNGRLIICAIMAVFCVIALIEIIYGRLQSHAEKEQIAIKEDNNNLLVHEVTTEGDDTGAAELPDIPLQGAPVESADSKDSASGMNDNAGITDNSSSQSDATANGTEGNSDVSSGENKGNNPEGTIGNDSGDSKGNNTANSTENYDMQIVFMGDSILDSVREYDGVAYLISQACNAKVYNMSIGGTTAALMTDERYSFDEWNSISLLGIVHAILGDIDGKIFEPYRAGEILKECDFSKTDYFIIEYGINDFLAKIPDSQYTNDGELRNIDAPHTYVGAMNLAISSLHNAFPDAKIMVISPHYCQFFSGAGYVGDSYSLDYGFGPMIDYSELCGYICNENKDKNVIYYNTIMDSGIDAYSADDYLEDGIHLTSAGRRAYADYASRLINSTFRKNE